MIARVITDLALDRVFDYEIPPELVPEVRAGSRVTVPFGHGTRDGFVLELAETISATALCGLGKSASSPVVSTIKNFREEYEAHIYDKRCPAGTCQKLKQIVIDPALCKGCTKCSRICPVSAISGKVKEPHTIDLNKCIRCGSCIGACAFKAIKEG